jgi:hypothetical protein
MIRVEIVDVGLAVRHDDHLRGMQVIAHHLPQRLRRPVLAKIDLQALLLLGLGQHLAHLRQDRQRGARRFGIVEKALAADVADQHLHPAAQLQPRRPARPASASSKIEMPTNTSTKSRAVRCRRSTKLRSCSISTRNGVGSRRIEIEARDLHRAGRQLHDARGEGFGLAVLLAAELCGVRSLFERWSCRRAGTSGPRADARPRSSWRDSCAAHSLP